MGWGDLVSTIIGIIFTVIGGFITGVSGVLVAYYSEKRRRAMEHFRDIKHLCLEPVLRELQELRGRFVISESRHPHKMCEQLEDEIPWWKSYSFRRVADPLLYEDLKNHYKDLYQNLENIEAWMRNKYPDFLLPICKLLEMISKDHEFKEFKAELERMNVGEGSPFIREEFLQNVVLFLLLDIDKGLWPSTYLRIKPVMNKAMHLKEKFYMVSEAQRARKEMRSIVAMIDNCIDKTKKIIRQTKLRGKCEYL
jgi:hypothetical protein